MKSFSLLERKSDLKRNHKEVMLINNELDKKELKLLEKSIKALKYSIVGVKVSDLENSVETYNTILTAFKTLQKNHEKEDVKDSIIKKTLTELEKEHQNIIELFEEGKTELLPSMMENKVLHQYEFLVKHYEKRIYLKQNNINEDSKFYKRFKTAGLLDDLDESVLDEVQSYWDKYYEQKTYPVLHLAYYNQTGKIEPRMIPQEVLNLELLPLLNKLNMTKFYSDKNVYDILINTDFSPVVVLKKVNDQYFDENNETISRGQAFRMFFNVKEDLIVKQSNSDDGKSVEKINYRNGNFYLNNTEIDLRKIENTWGIDFILQKVIKQHPMMAKPHKHSVNTFRMVTLRWNNKINYLMTYARFGADGEVKDNGGEGGIVISVSPEGEFSDFGMGDDAKIYKAHPTTGFEFKKMKKVPNFNEYIEFVKNLHNKILHHNYVSWDIAMGIDGKPIFIEMNFRGPVWKYQMVTERPIFGEFTEEILTKAVRERKKQEKLNKKKGDLE